MTPKTKNILIFTGAVLGTAAVGFLGYKLYIRLTKKVIEGKHNTVIIDEEEPDDVEVVGMDEKDTLDMPDSPAEKPMSEWTEDEWIDYHNS